MRELADGREGGEIGAPSFHCDVAPDELRLIDVDRFFVPVLFQDRHAMVGEVDLLRLA